MSTKPQNKSNAKRSADAAAKRTGTPHELFEVDGGWSFRPVEAEAKAETQATPEELIGTSDEANDAALEAATGPDEEDEELTTKALVARNKECAAERAEASSNFRAEVVKAMVGDGWREDVANEPEPARLITAGFEAGHSAAEVASSIAAWADAEDTAEQEAASRVEAEVRATPEQPQPEAQAELEAEAEAEAEPEPETVAETEAEPAPVKARPSDALERAARAALTAWADKDDPGLEVAMDDLRAALEQAGKPARTAKLTTATERKPREPGSTKQDTVIALLRREGGATSAAMQAATGWLPHTVRGFLAGLKKKGMTVHSTKETRTDGGFETVYRVPAATGTEAAAA